MSEHEHDRNGLVKHGRLMKRVTTLPPNLVCRGSEAGDWQLRGRGVEVSPLAWVMGNEANLRRIKATDGGDR